MHTYRGSLISLPRAYTGMILSDTMAALHTGQLAPFSRDKLDSSHYDDKHAIKSHGNNVMNIYTLISVINDMNADKMSLPDGYTAN
jgi:hypothetical protein